MPDETKPKPKKGGNKRKRAVLSDQQRRYADAYLICLNKAEAARRAGYGSPEGVSTYVHNLPQVRDYIDTRLEAKSKKFDLELDDILAELKLIGMARMSDFVEGDADGHPRFKAIDAIPEDKLAALEELSFDRIERTELDGKGEDAVPVAEVSTKKVKFKFAKKSALETLGKHLGMRTGSAEGPGLDPNVPRKVIIEGGLPEGPAPGPRDDSEEPKPEPKK